MKFNERRFRIVVKPNLLRCRPGDWNHCQRVVKWVKKLGRSRKDLSLLVAAAYVHDLGWRDVVKGGNKMTIAKVLKFEKIANRNSKPFITDLLSRLGYTPQSIKTILRLVRAADNHRSAKSDESVIVDADNLSKFAIGHLEDKYQKSNWVKTYTHFVNVLPSRIKNHRGRPLVKKLSQSLKSDILARGIKLP